MALEDPAAQVQRRLKEWRLSPTWLAFRIGESKQNVANWLSGRSRPHDPAVWDRMLEALPSPILGDPKIPVGYKAVKMRFAGEVPAGDWGDPLASEEFEEVDAKFEHPKRFLARVVGASCYPALHQGDLTIWHADMNPPYGVIVLAQAKGEHRCTVKELVFDPDDHRARLSPINPDYNEPSDGDGWGVIARLVAVIRKGDGPELTWYLPEGIRKRHLSG